MRETEKTLKVAWNWDPEWGVPEPFEIVRDDLYIEAQTDDISVIVVASGYLDGDRFNEPWGCEFKWIVLRQDLDPSSGQIIKELKSGTMMTPCQAAERAIDCAALHCRCSEEAFIWRVKDQRVIKSLADI
jgi:hypothetical protein